MAFAEGDLDSPFPQVETEDEIAEIAEIAAGTEAMVKRLHSIITDTGRLLNEMAKGNFNIATEREEEYVGAFREILMGLRGMNRQIDTTLRGVSEASRQVLSGSAHLAGAAQSLAEGATDQAASLSELVSVFTLRG